MKLTLIGTGLLLPVLAGCHAWKQEQTQNPQQVLDSFARSVKLNYVLERNNVDCPESLKQGHCARAELRLMPARDFDLKDWVIDFSHIHPIHQSLSSDFEFQHLQGDRHQLKPAAGFEGLSAGREYRIPFVFQNWMVSEYDVFPNYSVSAAGLTPRVIAATLERTDPQTGLDYLPFVAPLRGPQQLQKHDKDATQYADAAYLYHQNKGLNQQKPEALNTWAQILPRPLQQATAPGSLDVSSGLVLLNAHWPRAALAPGLSRLQALGLSFADKGAGLTLSYQKELGEEAYRLRVNKQGIEVIAGSESGAFYGLMSLASLYTPGSKTLPLVDVYDKPHYRYRGMHLDVARNFRSKAFVLKLLDQMSAYKLNRFHFHLGDDEGWRLEIDDLPELTDYAAWRCLDEQQCLSPMLGAGIEKGGANDGFFSRQDYLDILHYASARHIQVIPSFDMPGHARAAVKAMELRYRRYMALGDSQKAREFLLTDFSDKPDYHSFQYYNDNTINVCLESSYRFIDKVLGEVQKLHQDAAHPLTHYQMGADETEKAWDHSPVCKAMLQQNPEIEDLGQYFIARVANHIAERGITPAGWSDGLYPLDATVMPQNVMVHAWEHLPWSKGQWQSLLNRDWQVVLSTPDALYFDFPYSADPREPGYYWASRQTSSRKVFNLMPDNLPAHAELWTDREGRRFSLGDVALASNGDTYLGPVRPGKKQLGIQGQFWGETTRSDHMAEYKIFPRLLALAERAWHRPKWQLDYQYQGAQYGPDSEYFSRERRVSRDSDYARFASALALKEFPKLDRLGVKYRLAPPGAVIKNGVLHMNSAFPGMRLQYLSVKGQWRDYTGPVPITHLKVGQPEVRSVSLDGKRKGRSLQLAL